jgi:hypothetical protein
LVFTYSYIMSTTHSLKPFNLNIFLHHHCFLPLHHNTLIHTLPLHLIPTIFAIFSSTLIF